MALTYLLYDSFSLENILLKMGMILTTHEPHFSINDFPKMRIIYFYILQELRNQELFDVFYFIFIIIMIFPL